jgi:hypothetical protein
MEFISSKMEGNKLIKIIKYPLKILFFIELFLLNFDMKIQNYLQNISISVIKFYEMQLNRSLI